MSQDIPAGLADAPGISLCLPTDFVLRDGEAISLQSLTEEECTEVGMMVTAFLLRYQELGKLN